MSTHDKTEATAVAAAAATPEGRRVLYRASVLTPHWWEVPELIVFFELPEQPKADPGDILLHWLSRMWQCPEREMTLYNVGPECELLSRAIGHPATGDLRLLEVANYNGPVYARRDRTLMLVSPGALARLLKAQAALPTTGGGLGQPAPRTLLSA